MSLLLFILALLMIIFGAVRLFQRDFLWGVVLIVVGVFVWVISGGGYF